jgi:Fur family peroxide stress response transcriptional regulator
LFNAATLSKSAKVNDPKIRLEQMLSELRKQNFRITPQRHAVLKILAVSDGHPSVENIYSRVKQDFPTTSLATVYKTVTLLKEMGEVLELGFSHESSRYDGNNPQPHPHLICIRCHKIMDPDIETLTEMSDEISQKTGFEIVNHRLDFFGICPECREKG